MKEQNNLAELNAAMFEQLRRLNNTSLSKEKLNDEIERTRAVCLLASQIIANANLALKSHVVRSGGPVPPMLLTDETGANNGQI